MSTDPKLHNLVRERRLAAGWSQEELAQKSGLSRAGISAIEIDRVIPSAAAALMLAQAFECQVEDLFCLTGTSSHETAWAWTPQRDPCRFWQAEVNGRRLLYPVESTSLSSVPPDGISRQGSPSLNPTHDPAKTLVMACCDPAAGLLAHELLRTTGVRLLIVARSSGAALSLLQQGLVHIAGLHLSGNDGRGNAQVVKEKLGAGYSLLHLARWEAGLAVAPDRKIRSLQSAVRARLRWVGRETGSGARQCLDELLGKQAKFRRLAFDHRGVTEAIRCGWAEVGVSLRLTSEEAGLDFLSVREEAYDLCYATHNEQDLRFKALLSVIRSTNYRGMLGDLPGYHNQSTGSVETVE